MPARTAPTTGGHPRTEEDHDKEGHPDGDADQQRITQILAGVGVLYAFLDDAGGLVTVGAHSGDRVVSVYLPLSRMRAPSTIE